MFLILPQTLRKHFLKQDHTVSPQVEPVAPSIHSLVVFTPFTTVVGTSQKAVGNWGYRCILPPKTGAKGRTQRVQNAFGFHTVQGLSR